MRTYSKSEIEQGEDNVHNSYHSLKQILVWRVLLIGLIVIVLIISFVLIARSILDVNLLLAQDPVQADLIPVAQNPIAPLTVAIPVPSPPATSVQPVPTETLVPRASEIA